MTQKATKIAVAIAITAAFLVVAGCATKISLSVQRTPTLDTKGIKRIAIMPFTTSGSGTQSAASHATQVAQSRIQETNNFTLVNAQEIQRLQSSRQSIESHVDALFSGQITSVRSGDRSSQHQRTNRQTGVTTTYYIYTREVEVQFNYFFTRARDGSLIGPVSKRGTTSYSTENQSSLPSVDSLVANVITRELRNLARDVAPYTITVNRSLEKEPDKNLKPLMETALAQVKAGSYKQALDSYLEIYRNNKSVPAAINASILYEAIGETQTAADFMQGVFATTGNPRANEVVQRLNRELAEAAGVSDYASAQRASSAAATHAQEEITKILPRNPRLWISNNASADNQALVNDVIDDLTSLFLRSGVQIIDRQSIDLILAEQNFQMSGNVSDNDFVGIGRLAGANAIAVINITGTAATRRLQVRVLDIERGTVLFQSDTGENWQL